MSAQPRPSLQLVDADNEPLPALDERLVQAQDRIEELTEQLAAAEMHLAQAEERVAGQEALLKLAERELGKKGPNRQRDPKRPLIEQVFRHWKEACHKPRSPLTPDRWDAIRDALAYYTVEQLCLAIDGAAFDCFTKPQRNGRLERFNDLTTILATGARIESYANKAPVAERPGVPGEAGA